MISTENVLESPLAFKAKLAIGEDAYKSLKYGKGLQSVWDTVGIGATAAGVAGSAPVAGLIGTKVGFLAVFGFGNPVTPLPYIALAAVGSAAAYFGVMRVVKNFSRERVDVIPKFINSPLDILAVSLFDLLAPLAIKVADIDGKICKEERDLIVEYFCDDWGYSLDFVNQGFGCIEEEIRNADLEQLLQPISDFLKKNPDCNQYEMAKDILNFLNEISEVDGEITSEENNFLELSESHFKNANSFTKILSASMSRLSKKLKPRRLRSGV
jgi:hypothetical protein